MDVKKLYSDQDFSNASVPQDAVLIFNSVVDGSVVTRYKDSDGNFNTISSTGSASSIRLAYAVSNPQNNNIAVQPVTVYQDGTKASDSGAVVDALWNFSIQPSSIDLIDGLVFYSSLNFSSSAETGQELVSDSCSPVFTTQDGIPCAFFDGYSILRYSDANLPQQTQDRTISFWAKAISAAQTQCLFGFGQNTQSKLFALTVAGSTITLQCNANSLSTDSQLQLYDWHHYAVTSENSIITIYKDGQIIKTGSLQEAMQTVSDFVFIGGLYSNDSVDQSFHGYISSCRIYNRSLNASQIFTLAQEFKGNSSQSEQFQAGVVVQVDGQLKVQPLIFQGQDAVANGQPELYTAKIFNTGQDQPVYSDPVQTCQFYRCSSVQLSSSTWTGYRAVLNEGVYTFEDTVTSGLSYTSVTPQVGKIYSQDALVYVSSLYGTIPTDGLVFYAPLAEDKATAETGQKFTKTGTIEFSVQEGIPCAYFNGSSFLKTTDAGFPTGKNPVTISFWAKQLGGNGFFSYGKINQLYSGLWLTLNNNTANSVCAVINFWGIFYYIGNSANDNKFHHFCIGIMPNEDSGVFYLDGIEQSVSLAANSTPGKSFDDVSIQLSGTMEIGSYNDPQEGRKYLDGYLSSFRVYNRTLGKAEIQALYNEFTPTQVNT